MWDGMGGRRVMSWSEEVINVQQKLGCKNLPENRNNSDIFDKSNLIKAFLCIFETLKHWRLENLQINFMSLLEKWRKKRWNKTKHSVKVLFYRAPGSLVTARGIDHSARTMMRSTNVPPLNLRSTGRAKRQYRKLDRRLLVMDKSRGIHRLCWYLCI